LGEMIKRFRDENVGGEEEDQDGWTRMMDVLET